MLLLDTSAEHSEYVINRIKSSLDSFNDSGKTGYDIQFSYGIVHFDPVKHETVNDLLLESDRLMYRMKHSKKRKEFVKYAN
jgi:GGDEF domain-containing protein